MQNDWKLTASFFYPVHDYISIGVKPHINQSDLKTCTKVILSKEKSAFPFIVLWKILNEMAEIKLVIEGQYKRIILLPHLITFSCILIIYRSLHAWPIHTEIQGITIISIYRVGDVPQHGISLQDVKWVSEWLLFNANSAILHLYHGENKLIFNEMMMKSALY